MSECCTESRIIPGARGGRGADGTDGVDGINAFTLTTAAFTMPAAGLTVTVAVVEANWVSPNGTVLSGQVLHVQNAGYFTATQILSDTSLVITNIGYTGNAVAGTLIPGSSKVSPGGLVGPQGATGASGGGGGVTGGVGDPNGVALAAGYWLYIDTNTGSIWEHIDAASTSVWFLKVA